MGEGGGQGQTGRKSHTPNSRGRSIPRSEPLCTSASLLTEVVRTILEGGQGAQPRESPEPVPLPLSERMPGKDAGRASEEAHP